MLIRYMSQFVWRIGSYGELAYVWRIGTWRIDYGESAYGEKAYGETTSYLDLKPLRINEDE